MPWSLWVSASFHPRDQHAHFSSALKTLSISCKLGLTVSLSPGPWRSWSFTDWCFKNPCLIILFDSQYFQAGFILFLSIIARNSINTQCNHYCTQETDPIIECYRSLRRNENRVWLGKNRGLWVDAYPADDILPLYPTNGSLGMFTAQC